MTRKAKLGGGVVVLAVVYLVGWYLLAPVEAVLPLSRFFRFGTRKFMVAKAAQSPRTARLPKLYLWAWERPEDLKFLGDKKVGVAFLAQTVSLSPPLAIALPKSDTTPDTPFFSSIRVNVRPRLQPLRINPGTPLMAVVRIESVRAAFSQNSTDKPNAASSLSPQDVALFATLIANVSQTSGVTAVQIDFDATQSEKALYRDLLVEVRKRLPAEMPLSITALASWCIGDRWLEQLPRGTIDEAVPMLFRMGSGTTEVSHYLATGNEFTVSACTTSLGLSTDEPFSRDILNGGIPVNRTDGFAPRIYVFSPHPWSQDAAKELYEEIAKWH